MANAYLTERIEQMDEKRTVFNILTKDDELSITFYRWCNGFHASMKVYSFCSRQAYKRACDRLVRKVPVYAPISCLDEFYLTNLNGSYRVSVLGKTVGQVADWGGIAIVKI